MPIEERGATKRMAARSCVCESCKLGRHEPHKISHGLIHGYSEVPRGGWKMYMTPAERATGRAAHGYPSVYLGVELETMLPAAPKQPERPRYPSRTWDTIAGSYANVSPEAMDAYYAAEGRYDDTCAAQDRAWMNGLRVTGSQATSMRRPFGFWLPKHDGSVSGPEFASHPATLAWWMSHKRSLSSMMTMLLHAGLRSHEGDACGMHVNISTTAFDGAEHLANLATLLHVNKAWSRRMAQRTIESAGHWARFDNDAFRSPNAIRRWSRDVEQEGYASQDRYGVLNASNEGRVEFRLPRGTLRIDRFFKNLEWTAAMVEFTRPVNLWTASSTQERDRIGVAMTPAAFMRWTMSHKEYPYLRAFLTERFAASLTTRKAA